MSDGLSLAEIAYWWGLGSLAAIGFLLILNKLLLPK